MSQIIHIPKVQDYDNSRNPSQPTEINDEWLTNNGFFPDISLLEVRNAMRVDGLVTNERLKHATLEAMMTVNDDLKGFMQSSQAADKANLTECGEEWINGELVQVYRYKRAVYCLAVANLYERYRSFDSTKEGNDKADELLNTAGDLRRDYHHAVRDILGTHRLIAELI